MSPALLQIAMAHSTEMARAQDRIIEINQRVVMAGSRFKELKWDVQNYNQLN